MYLRVGTTESEREDAYLMASVARGKALVAKLRADPKVRDAEALAAWIGRRKKRKKLGAKVGGGSLADRIRASKAPAKAERKSPLAKKPVIDDDPFADDPFDEPDTETPEERKRRKMEAAILRKMQAEDRRNLYRAIHDQGGIKPRTDLREEYRQIPNNFKRKDGLTGDEMAEHLCSHHAELGICSERDLIDYFQRDYRRAA